MVRRLHRAFHPRHKRRAHAQLIHPEAEQQRSQRKVAGHLAAHAHPNAMRVRRVRHHLEQPKHRRMRRLIKMRDALVHPIDRDRVLNQVVRADAEKIDFARQRVGA